jgi:hypothetical protein
MLRTSGLSCYYSTARGPVYRQVMQKKASKRIDFVPENQ